MLCDPTAGNALIELTVSDGIVSTASGLPVRNADGRTSFTVQLADTAPGEPVQALGAVPFPLIGIAQLDARNPATIAAFQAPGSPAS